VFFVVLTIVGLGYLVLRGVEFLNVPATASNVVTTDATATIAVVAPTPMPADPTAPVAATAVVAQPTAQTANAAVTPTLEAPIVLGIKIDDRQNPGSWVNVKIDNKSVFQRVLKAGESLRYTAQHSVWVRAGNAYVVTVNVNGVDQRLSTTPGDVVFFSLRPP
jgi:hypothetical protein